MKKSFSYNDIKDDYENSWHVPYSVLLKTNEWLNLRERIVTRDNHTCNNCHQQESQKQGGTYYRFPTMAEAIDNQKRTVIDYLGDGSVIFNMPGIEVVGYATDTPIILHVHHKYYIATYLPWEYKEHALVTLCHQCHYKIHREEKIPVYLDDSFKEKLQFTVCDRCSGTGFLEEYFYYQNGVCFKCDGRKYMEFTK